MNKTEFVNALASQIEYSIEDTYKINTILEKNFFISQKKRDIIVEELKNTFAITNEEALRIYDCARNILNQEIKNRIKHPFGKNK